MGVLYFMKITETIELTNEDCFDLFKRIKDKSIDLVLTDPPYGMSFQSGSRKDKYEKIKNDDENSDSNEEQEEEDECAIRNIRCFDGIPLLDSLTESDYVAILRHNEECDTYCLGMMDPYDFTAQTQSPIED